MNPRIELHTWRMDILCLASCNALSSKPRFQRHQGLGTSDRFARNTLLNANRKMRKAYDFGCVNRYQALTVLHKTIQVNAALGEGGFSKTYSKRVSNFVLLHWPSSMKYPRHNGFPVLCLLLCFLLFTAGLRRNNLFLSSANLVVTSCSLGITSNCLVVDLVE
jgi:hypothetical protein